MKVIEVIVQLFLERMREAAGLSSESLAARGQKALICGLVGLAAVIIFCAGLIIAVISLASEYDSFRLLTFSALVGSGVGMMGLSSLVILALFAIPTGANKTKSSEKFAGYLTPALQEALAVLVLDLVKQRSDSRTAERPQQPGPAPSSHEPTYSTH